MKKAQPRQTLNGHSIFSSENAQDAYYKGGGYMAPILPMHFDKGTQIFRDTTSLPFLEGGPLVDRTRDGKIRDSIYASALGNYYQAGGMLETSNDVNTSFNNGGQLYTYSGRPGATYQKVNGQWYIHTEHTNGEFIPVKDPTGKRTALLNAQAKPMATTANKYQRTYDLLLDNKPQTGETTQKVAQDYMMAKDSKQYAEKSMEAQARAQAEKSPEQIANEVSASSLKNSLTPEEKALAKEYFNNPEYNYYHDPIRGVREGNVTAAQSFGERMDELVWPAFQPFTGNPSFEKTKLQEFEKNKVKRFQTLDDAMKAVYAQRVANNRGQSDTRLTPSEEMQLRASMPTPGQMASGRAAPVDWLWAAPIAGPAALEALGGLGAMSVPGMSAIPGATVGNLVNSGFIANSLMQTPSNIKSWYDVSQGKKDSQEAMLESAEIAAGMIGSGAGLKSLGQDTKQLGKYLTTSKETSIDNIVAELNLPKLPEPFNYQKTFNYQKGLKTMNPLEQAIDKQASEYVKLATSEKNYERARALDKEYGTEYVKGLDDLKKHHLYTSNSTNIWDDRLPLNIKIVPDEGSGAGGWSGLTNEGRLKNTMYESGIGPKPTIFDREIAYINNADSASEIKRRINHEIKHHYTLGRGKDSFYDNKYGNTLSDMLNTPAEISKTNPEFADKLIQPAFKDKYTSLFEYYEAPHEVDAYVNTNLRDELVDSKILKDQWDELTDEKLARFLMGTPQEQSKRYLNMVKDEDFIKNFNKGVYNIGIPATVGGTALLANPWKQTKQD